VPTAAHNLANSSARLVLNIARESMAATGFSPATRLFEAAGAGACVITDAWEGIEMFFKPEQEILIAHDGNEVANHVRNVPAERARAIGAAARARCLREHLYSQRAAQVHEVLTACLANKRAALTA
jgi:spore maturation protein CgeB